jgi:hypothetical protein
MVEVEPNDSLLQAYPLLVPATITGNVFHTDADAELRFYDFELEQWRYIELHDIYRFTVSQERSITITLESLGGTSVDLNLLLVTPSEIDDEESIFVDGELAELVDLSTANDPLETINVTLSPGEYYIAIQAFLTRARTSYILTIE